MSARSVAPLLFLFFCHPAFATNLQQLALDPGWLALLHYTQGDDGTLRDDPEGNTRCRFPARQLWLSRKLKDFSAPDPVECPEYKDWEERADVESISIVYAAGHMKSPASYFGHNLLKFNSASGKDNILLDQTVNYGADVPPGETGLPYFVKGIFGGYQAHYESLKFYRHMAEFGEDELRDLWEYRLDLEPWEVKLILLHTWELHEQKLTYYFFRENCAYQIAMLLGLITTEELVPRYLPWTMPYNVFAALSAITRNGKPLVSDTIYHPSRRSRFHRGFFSLNTEQRQRVSNYINTSSADRSAVSLEQVDTPQLIDNLIDYYEFRLRLIEDDPEATQEKQALLLKRFAHPPSAKALYATRQPYPPHLAQKPGYLSLASLKNRTQGQTLELRMRPTYFDYLGLKIGRNTAGSFTGLDTTIALRNNDIQLQKLSLLDITNLVPSITGISGDATMSWHFRFGFDRTNNACQSCTRPMLDWQGGHAWKRGSDITLYALAGGRLQKSYANDNPLVLRAQAGITGRLHDNLRIHASIGRHEDTGASGNDRNRLSLNARFGDSRLWDIRLHFLKDVTEEFGISAGLYW